MKIKKLTIYKLEVVKENASSGKFKLKKGIINESSE